MDGQIFSLQMSASLIVVVLMPGIGKEQGRVSYVATLEGNLETVNFQVSHFQGEAVTILKFF